MSLLEVGEERYVLRMMDDVPPEAHEVVERSEDLGMDDAVLTGDVNRAASFVADAVSDGVTE